MTSNHEDRWILNNRNVHIFRQNIEIPEIRTGWLGVWDALKAAITRKNNRYTIIPIEIQFVKSSNSDSGLENPMTYVNGVLQTRNHHSSRNKIINGDFTRINP